MEDEARRLADELGISVEAAKASLRQVPVAVQEARQREREYYTWRKLRVRALWKLLLVHREFMKNPRSLYHIAAYKVGFNGFNHIQYNCLTC